MSDSEIQFYDIIEKLNIEHDEALTENAKLKEENAKLKDENKKLSEDYSKYFMECCSSDI